MSNFDQFFVGLPIKLIKVATSHLGSPPVYPKMWSVRAGLFPPGARAKRAEASSRA